MKIIAIDFDGTIVHNRFPRIGPPMLGAHDVIKELMSMPNVKLILWTVRDGEYLSDAVEWCEHKGLVFDAVNENINSLSTSPKVYANYYIDDRASCCPVFDGQGRAVFIDWEAIREDMELKLSINFNQGDK